MYAGDALSDRPALAALSAMCAMLDACLPDREAHPALFDESLSTLDGFSAPRPFGRYARWELALLREIGFGLDLAACSVTGVTEGLAFVSPRSGRAVTREGAGSYVERLLKLPSFLLDQGQAEVAGKDVSEALRLTGHFLDAHVFTPHERKAPAARTRFVDLIGT
jgi:DNA repair protein RecO (recombination protein O)